MRLIYNINLSVSTKSPWSTVSQIFGGSQIPSRIRWKVKDLSKINADARRKVCVPKAFSLPRMPKSDKQFLWLLLHEQSHSHFKTRQTVHTGAREEKYAPMLCNRKVRCSWAFPGGKVTVGRPSQRHGPSLYSSPGFFVLQPTLSLRTNLISLLCSGKSNSLTVSSIRSPGSCSPSPTATQLNNCPPNVSLSARHWVPLLA